LNNLSNKVKQTGAAKKGLIVIIIFVMIESIFFLPVYYKKIQYDNLQLYGIKSIEYVEYEKEMFSSVILSLRYTDDDKIIDEFGRIISEGKFRPYYKQKNVHKVLIIKTEKNKTIYAYINSDIFGFDYGKINIQIQNSEQFIKKIPAVELVRKQN